MRRAARYFGNGHNKRARALYRAILDQEPKNARALAAMAQVDAVLGVITFDEALATIRGIINENPDNERLPPSLLNVLFRMGRMNEYAVERRRYFEHFPDSPIALQVWANGLQVDPETRNDPGTPLIAWGFYQQALLAGPLESPCFRAAAFNAARKADRLHARDALRSSSLIERWSIRTRNLGPRRMAFVLFAFVFLAGALFQSNFTASLFAQGLALVWGTWSIICNSFLCCKQCRNAWIGLVGLFTLLAAYFDHQSTWYVPYAIGVLVIAWGAKKGWFKNSSPTNQVREDAESSARSRLTLSLLLLVIADAVVAGRITNHHVTNPVQTSIGALIVNVVFVILCLVDFRHRMRVAKDIDSEKSEL